MSTRQPAEVPRALSTARRQLTQWRRRQPGRKRLPKALWEMAVALAREHGVHRTARTLGLKCESLKKHLAGAASDAGDPVKPKPADFLELVPGGLMVPSPECLIEWENGDGGKMRMHVKGIGLARVCREILRQDPFSGGVFVFCNRGRRAIKILVYDGQGFWLCQKRLSQVRFRWWPQNPQAAIEVLEAHQLPVLLSGGNPAVAKGAPAWRRVDTRA